MKSTFVLALVLFLSFPRLFAGTVRGTVNNRLGIDNHNIVIYLETKPIKKFDAPSNHAIMDQKGMRFTPHVLPILVGTTVDFLNSDDILHNIFSPDYTGGKFTLGTWAQGIVKSYTFTAIGSATLLCNVHPEMEAYILVLPTPYFALSDSTGKYQINDVPPGSYLLNTWYEPGETTRQKILVNENRPTIINIKIK